MQTHISTALENAMMGVRVNQTTNQTFPSALTGWTATAGVVQSGSTPPSGYTGEALFTVGSSTASELRFTAALTVIAEQMYKVSFWGKQLVNSLATVLVGTTAGASDIHSETITITASWVAYKSKGFTIPVGTTSAYLTIKTSTSVNSDSMAITDIQFYNAEGSFKGNMTGCQCQLWSGSMPATAATAPSGTLLATLLAGGTGNCHWDDAVLGTVNMAAGNNYGAVTEVWQTAPTGCVAANTIGYARFILPADLGTTNSTDKRLDVDVATSGAVLNLSNTSTSVGAPLVLQSFTITLPATT